MGYRSDVAGGFSVDAYNYPATKEEGITKFKEMIGLIKLSKFYEIMNSTEQDRTCIGWDCGRFVFHAENWKWYPDYDAVQAWKDLWEQMQGVEGISGLFNRVGEETDDIEEDNFGDDVDFDMFYCRSMLCFEASSILGQRNTSRIHTDIEQTNLTNVS